MCCTDLVHQNGTDGFDMGFPSEIHDILMAMSVCVCIETVKTPSFFKQAIGFSGGYTACVNRFLRF